MPKNLINIDEMAKILGVSKASLYGWASQGLIPVIRVSRALRFDPDEVIKYFQDGKFEKTKRDMIDAVLNKIRR